MHQYASGLLATSKLGPIRIGWNGMQREREEKCEGFGKGNEKEAEKECKFLQERGKESIHESWKVASE